MTLKELLDIHTAVDILLTETQKSSAALVNGAYKNQLTASEQEIYDSKMKAFAEYKEIKEWSESEIEKYIKGIKR